MLILFCHFCRSAGCAQLHPVGDDSAASHRSPRTLCHPHLRHYRNGLPRGKNRFWGRKKCRLFFSRSSCKNQLSVSHRVKFGVRSSKFIWAPCAQLYSLANTPQLPPHPRHLGSYTMALIGQPRLMASLCNPLRIPIMKQIPEMEEQTGCIVFEYRSKSLAVERGGGGQNNTSPLTTTRRRPPPPHSSPLGVGEKFSQTISNLGHAALLRRYELTL